MSESESPCETCETLRHENALLRQQIFELTGEPIIRVNSRWLAIFFVGWALLTIVPAAIMLVLDLDTNNWYGYAEYGIAFAAPWTQWSIAANFTILLAISAWKRLLLFLLASMGLAISWSVVSNVSSNVEDELMMLVLDAPIAAIAIAIPTFICRMMLGWRIVHPSNDQPVRSTSIASYLVLMIVVAIVMAGLPKLPSEVKDLFFELEFLTILGTPTLAGMFITVVMVHLLLGKSVLAWISGVLWLSLGLSFACILSASGPYAYAVAEDPLSVTGYLAFGVSWILSFALWYLLACLWLRWLGYRVNRRVPLSEVNIRGARQRHPQKLERFQQPSVARDKM